MNPSENTFEMKNMPKTNQPYNAPCINFDNHNWPICFSLVHFDLEEISGNPKRFTIKLYSIFIVTIVILCINCIFLNTHKYSTF